MTMPLFSTVTMLPRLLANGAMVGLVGCAIGLTGCDNANSSNTKASAKSTATQTASTNAPTATQTTTTPAQNDAKIQQLLAQNLKKSGINAQVLSAVPTSMPNMYWVKLDGMPAIFTDSTGQYIIQGDIVKVGGDKPEHITADLLAQDAKTALATIDKKDMIIFPAKGETKAVIDVFTDADCGYCRKLHSEIDQINALGIEVRYLPWPRSEQTFPIMEKIWCSQDRTTALTKAKQGDEVDAPMCDNPVKRIHDLGLSIGISGTPAIFSQDGKQLGGYLPPQELARALNIQ